MEEDCILIGHAEDERVTITLLGYAHAWWETRVDVVCGVWRGSFGWYTFAGELRAFGEEVRRLYGSLSGTARLMPMEPNLAIEMTGDGKGHIIVTGKAEAGLGSCTHLTFRFAIDQTELPAIAAALIRADGVPGGVTSA